MGAGLSRVGMFSPEAEARSRLPVVLLTGFLGSGKTTLVNAVLRDPRMSGTAVAVNEFGAVPLDQHLIEHGADKTVVLANGCLCCNLAGDMEEAVMRVFSRRQSGAIPGFRRMVIEPSGLADPAPIAQAILRNPVLSRMLRLDAIVATVDAVFAAAQLARHAETRKQVALADRIVLTKTDMADTGPAIAAVRRHNAWAPVDVAVLGGIDPGVIFPAEFLDADATAAGKATPSRFQTDLVQVAEHAGATDATVLTADQPLQWPAFDDWLRGIRLGHAEQLLRVKAMLNVAGVAGPVVVHGVHHVLHRPVVLDTWPDNDRRSRVVLITQGAPVAAIRGSWAGTFHLVETV